MNPILKKYIAVFLVCTISYGILMFLSDALFFETESLIKYVISAAFFGLLMSAILVTYQRYRIRKDGADNSSAENLKVNQSTTVKSQLSLNEIYAKIKSDPNFGNMKIDSEGSMIEIKTGTTWRSWGEIISIRGGHENEYVVSSNSKVKTTLIDYGKNLNNVNSIASIIESPI